MEPLFLLCLGGVLWWYGMPLGMVLIGVAALVWMRSHLAGRMTRHKLLDVVDAQIEEDTLASAMHGASKQACDGFTVPGASRLTQRQCETLMGDMAPLDPELEALLASRNGQSASTDDVR